MVITDRMLDLIIESSRRSLARAYTNSRTREMAALTPESELEGVTRGTPGVKARRKAFEADLKARHLGYIKTKGTYEGGHENSYVIYSHNRGDDGGQLKRSASELGAKYGQKSILHKSPNKEAELVGTAKKWIDTEGNVRNKGESQSIGGIHFNRKDETGAKPMYRTDLPGKKRGYFDYSK